MRQAPPVSVLCHGRAWRRAQAAIWALAAAALCVWAMQHLLDPAPSAATLAGVAALVFLASGSLALRLQRPVAATLSWDGRQWTLAGQAGQAALMLQTDGFVLVRLRTARSDDWLAVQRHEAGPAWHGLRVALNARPMAAEIPLEGQGR